MAELFHHLHRDREQESLEFLVPAMSLRLEKTTYQVQWWAAMSCRWALLRVTLLEWIWPLRFDLQKPVYPFVRLNSFRRKRYQLLPPMQQQKLEHRPDRERHLYDAISPRLTLQLSNLIVSHAVPSNDAVRPQIVRIERK
jgi:hypothetical protein